METLVSSKSQDFRSLLLRIDSVLDRNIDSLNVFEWRLESHYDSQIKTNSEFYSNRPDLIKLENKRITFELQELLDYFISKDEYEKCTIINNYKNKLNG